MPTRREPGVVVDCPCGVVRVSVSGQVDRSKASAVRGALTDVAARGVRELVVDLTDCWDGAVLLPSLARARADALDLGGTMLVVGLALPEFLHALRSAPLDEVFVVFDAVRRAARVPERSSVAAPPPRQVYPDVTPSGPDRGGR